MNVDRLKALRFNYEDHPAFFSQLNKEVRQYFKSKSIDKYGNLSMKVKTVFMLSLYFIPFILILTQVFSTSWAVFLGWIIMGFGVSGIGLSVMHDANHGAYSKNQKVNNFFGQVLNLIGGYHINWKVQHNVLHHSFTNIHGYDADIESPLFRFSPTQEKKSFFKWQAFYAPFLYSLMTIYWATFKDFTNLKIYREEGFLKTQNISYNKALTELIVYKVLYYILTLLLPMIVSSVAWWEILIGFVVMHLLSGLILSMIFQPAHVLEETIFVNPESEHPEKEDPNQLENSWAVHQLKTTSNFAMNSRWFSWFVGGLNYQVEHHLFPNICHVHYKQISKIVKKVTKQYDLPYYNHKTFLGAIKSHFKLLHTLGNH